MIVGKIPCAVIGPSKFVINIHKKYGFFKKTYCESVSNPVSVNNEKAKAVNRNRQTMDILYAGRLSKEKGIDFLIDVFKGLKENFLRLHIVGDGPQKEYLENLAGKSKRIIFYGKVDHRRISDFYKTVDILVLPSIWYEVFGMVIIEAFSFGVIAVASDIGGIKEIIQNGHNGFLFSPKNKENLEVIFRNLIYYFKEKKEELELLSKNALKSAFEFEDSKIVSRIKGIYKTCLK